MLDVQCSMFDVHFLVDPCMKHSFRQDLSAKLKADFQQDYQDFFVLVGLATVPAIFLGTR